MKIAITGSSGFVGRALTAALVDRGDTVTPAKRKASNGNGGLVWDSHRGFDPPHALSGYDAVVHLAGESVGGGRWTDERKAEILRSRVEGTAAVVQAIEAASPRPTVFVCASAVGYYGDRGDVELTEDEPPGEGFLAEVSRRWEDEAKRAEFLDGGRVRVARLRFGTILGRGGGALPRMLPAFRMGVGGRLGDGHQYMSWVHIDDVVAAIITVLHNEDAFGAFNVTAPDAATNREFTRALGKALHRPTVLPVPQVALKAVFGEMGEALLLAGQRAIPQRLQRLGFRFEFGNLRAALDDLLG